MGSAPRFIAEVSSNHGADLQRQSRLSRDQPLPTGRSGFAQRTGVAPGGARPGQLRRSPGRDHRRTCRRQSGRGHDGNRGHANFRPANGRTRPRSGTFNQGGGSDRCWGCVLGPGVPVRGRWSPGRSVGVRRQHRSCDRRSNCLQQRSGDELGPVSIHHHVAQVSETQLPRSTRTSPMRRVT